MKLSLLFACIWALAATVTAFLPMRRQFPPGIVLLILAPVLIIWIGRDYGLWVALAAFLGFVSMFRRPLFHFARYLIGRPGPGEGQP